MPPVVQATTKPRWAELTEAYNDSVDSDVYGSYAFVKDEHVDDFVSKYDLCNYKQSDWEKACGWFKEIVKDYTKALQNLLYLVSTSLTSWLSSAKKHRCSTTGCTWLQTLNAIRRSTCSSVTHIRANLCASQEDQGI
jgi:hypothetical protein